MVQKSFFDSYFKEISRVIVGQKEMLKHLLIGIMTDSNVLMEGYPGLAKTRAIQGMSELMDLKFSRIQGTPDLMPSDITGTYIIEETKSGKRGFRFQPGPIFANIVLMDEINRATPKTQAALLEAMQEKQVSVGNETYKLEPPFFVLATQNPIEQEGSLTLDQQVLVNSKFISGHDLLESAKIENSERIRYKGKCLYKLKNAFTLSMNYTGKLVRSACWLYTLKYSGQVIALETNTGRRIQVTDNHPFVVEKDGIYVWKKAGELRNNDMLVCPKSIKLFEKAQQSKPEAQRTKSGQTILLLSEQDPEQDSKYDITSEPVKVIRKKGFTGTVFGLTVPGLQNYIAGTGGCGINHNTYPLPEAQADRFLLKIIVDYPNVEEEIEIVNMATENPNNTRLRPMLNAKKILDLQRLTQKVPIANDIKRYAVNLVSSTRKNKELIEFGASPRASIGLIMASKASALMSGRRYVSKDDIKELAFPVLRHRIILSFEAQRQNMTEDDVIRSLLR